MNENNWRMLHLIDFKLSMLILDWHQYVCDLYCSTGQLVKVKAILDCVAKVNISVLCCFLQDIARDCLRIDTLQLFGDYLCGIDPPMLDFNVETKEYYSVTPSNNYSEDQQSDLPSDTDEVRAIIIKIKFQVYL